jgi:hypothetical protein
MSIRSIDPQLHLSKRKNSRLSQIQEEWGEEETTKVENPKVEIEAIMNKGMLQEKA